MDLDGSSWAEAAPPGEDGDFKKVPTLHERRAAQTRREILAEARQLLGSQGFESTTMDQIARALNIRRATLYNHFPSKDELISACIDSTTDTLLGATGPASDGSLAECLLAHFQRSHEQLIADEYRFAFRLMISSASPQATAAVDRGYAQAHEAVLTILNRARDRGQIAIDTELDELADDIMAEFIGLSMLSLHDPRRFPYVRGAERTVARIVAAIAPKDLD
jgi:AcrR family transcriptional regulator